MARSCQLLLVDRLGIGQQVVSDCTVHHMIPFGFPPLSPPQSPRCASAPRAHQAYPASARSTHRTPGSGTALPGAGATPPRKRRSEENNPYLPSRCHGAPSWEAAMVPAAGRGRRAGAGAAAPRPSPSRGTRCPRGGPRRRRPPARLSRGPGRHPALGRNSPTC